MLRYILPCVALVAIAVAQTFTSCNPLNSTCPDDPALGTTFYEVYNSSLSEFDSRFWNITAGTDLISFDDDSAVLALLGEKDSVTIQSNFYIFWGQVEILMQAAPGTGIISTAILLSDDLDEIDWEIKGGNTTTVSTNYYGWGRADTQFNAEYPALDSPQTSYHNYTINWTQEKIQYILDGNVVREVGYQEPGEYPQTPCQIKFGIWCGGCSSQEGTVQWAGGSPDFSQAPFQMHIKSIKITDGTQNATSYSYGDHSGNYNSIKVALGESDASNSINHLSTTQSVEKKWSGLSTGAKIGILCGVLGALALATIVFAFYCASQRKKGRAEALLHEKEWEAQNAELMEYRAMMAKGTFAVSRQSILAEYDSNPRPARFSSRFSGRF